MSTLSTLVVKLVGETGHFISSMNDAGKHAKGVAGKIGDAFNGVKNVVAVGAGAAVAGIAAIGGAAFKAAMDLDGAYDTIAIGTGASGKNLQKLKGDFDAVFKSIPTDAQPAADVITELNRRLNLSGPALQDLAVPLLEMTRLLGGDAKQNAELYSRVIGDWGIPQAEAAAGLDMMFAASQQTGIGVDKLMEKVVQFGSPLRLMGFSLGESVAMLGKWEKEGVNTELVLGSLRIAAGKFAKENVPLREGLMKSIEQIKNMKDSSAALAMGMAVFGAKAGPDMVAAIREGRFELGDLVQTLQDSSGAIMEAADATADFPERLKIFGNQAMVALAPLGMAIMDGIGKGLEAIGPVIGAVLPRVVEVLTAIGSWISTNVGPIFDQITRVVQGVVAWIQNNLPEIQAVITTTWDTIKARIEPVIDAIRSIIESVFGGIASFVNEHGAEIKQFVEDAWNGIRAIVEGVVNIVYAVVAGTLNAIAGFLRTHGDTIKAVIEGVWGAIKNTVETVINVIRQIVQTVTALLRGDWQSVWNGIKSIVETIWNGIVTAWNTFWGTIDSVLKTLSVNVKAGWDSFWGGIDKFLHDIWNGILSFIEGMVNSVIDTINGMVDAFNATIGKVTGEIPKLEHVALTTKTNMTTLMNGTKTDVGTAATGIANKIQTMVGTVTGYVATQTPGMMNPLRNEMSGARNHAVTKADEAKGAMTGLIDHTIAFVAANAPGMMDPMRDEIGGLNNEILDWVNSMLEAIERLLKKITGINIDLPEVPASASNANATGQTRAAGSNLSDGLMTAGASRTTASVTIASGAIVVYGAPGMSAEMIADEVLQRAGALADVRMRTG